MPLCELILFKYIAKIWKKGEWNFETSKEAATFTEQDYKQQPLQLNF